MMMMWHFVCIWSFLYLKIVIVVDTVGIQALAENDKWITYEQMCIVTGKPLVHP